MLSSNAQFLFIIYLVLFHLNVIGNAIASAKCRRAEYRVGGECCPTCPPGMYVSRHCTEFRSTSCASCTEGTFQDGDNGREQCFSCKHCDAGLGLKVKKSCSSTSDAVCEVLDGFFCSDSNRGGCRAAQRHTVCSPGQYIGLTGTADKDTECFHCTDGTFSDGASSSCQSHTKCDSEGLKLMTPGTDSTDSECGEHGPHAGLVAGKVIPGVILKKETLQLLVDFEKLIPKMETPELERECYNLYSQLLKKKKKTEQKKKLRRLRIEFVEKRKILEQDSQLTERMYIQLLEDTEDLEMAFDDGAAGEGTSDLPSAPLLSPELPAGLETSIPPAPSSETQPAGLETSIPPAPSSETQPAGLETSIPPAPSSETQPAGLETSIPPAPSSETQPAGLETSIPPAPSSETQPAGLETSIPPAPSSETQPAEETTPLMSSESPAPTGDQQEHTSRTSTPDVTMDGHDDDQSLDALAYRSGTGQLDIEMGPVQTLPKDRNRIL
ncbi:unnamed protein product [Gadus morhua 'NCC']